MWHLDICYHLTIVLQWNNFIKISRQDWGESEWSNKLQIGYQQSALNCWWEENIGRISDNKYSLCHLPETYIPFPTFQDCLPSLFDHPLHISRTNVGKYNQKRSVPGLNDITMSCKQYAAYYNTVYYMQVSHVLHISGKFEVIQRWVKSFQYFDIGFSELKSSSGYQFNSNCFNIQHLYLRFEVKPPFAPHPI